MLDCLKKGSWTLIWTSEGFAGILMITVNIVTPLI